MWPFKKKPPSQDLSEDWRQVLRKCNFLLAKRELQSFFDLVTREAAAQGQEAIYRVEFVRGWQTFAKQPCFKTAVAFIEQAPDYAGLIWGYFVECCPGGRWLIYDSLLGHLKKDEST